MVQVNQVAVQRNVRLPNDTHRRRPLVVFYFWLDMSWPVGISGANTQGKLEQLANTLRKHLVDIRSGCKLEQRLVCSRSRCKRGQLASKRLVCRNAGCIEQKVRYSRQGCRRSKVSIAHCETATKRASFDLKHNERICAEHEKTLESFGHETRMHEKASASWRAENEHAAKHVEHEEAEECRMGEMEVELGTRNRELVEKFETEQQCLQELRQQLIMASENWTKYDDLTENEIRKVHELRSECTLEERAAEPQQNSLSTAQALLAKTVKQEKRTPNKAQKGERSCGTKSAARF